VHSCCIDLHKHAISILIITFLWRYYLMVTLCKLKLSRVDKRFEMSPFVWQIDTQHFIYNVQLCSPSINVLHFTYLVPHSLKQVKKMTARPPFCNCTFQGKKSSWKMHMFLRSVSINNFRTRNSFVILSLLSSFDHPGCMSVVNVVFCQV